jgi:NTP pyrophosphatase (non-canonical NTP hydrolase)
MGIKMNNEHDELFYKAYDKWGNTAQTDMAIEECSELIKAICKNRRRHSEESLKNIQDEIADVTIMMRQMQLIFGEKEVEERIQYKIERLNERLK